MKHSHMPLDLDFDVWTAWLWVYSTADANAADKVSRLRL